MKILVSNDDGIDAPGIRYLADAMKGLGDIVIVAPDREQSGAGHSLTLHRPVRMSKRGENRFAVDGTPTDCVTLGVLELMKGEAPALIVSGINGGPNLGDDITYSGTVAAALEGAILGIPSIAFSLSAVNGEPANYGPAAEFATRVAREVIKKGLPKGLLLNVNVPNLPEGTKVERYVVTRTGKRRFNGAIEEKRDPRGRVYFWIGGEDMGFDDIDGTDSNAVGRGWASITPIRLDFTYDEFLPHFREWQF